MAADRDQRDQRHEQRVLEQVLAFVATRERLESVDELHVERPCSLYVEVDDSAVAAAMLVKIVLTLLPAACDRADRDERDQRHEQRVLEQVLAFVGARKRLNPGDECHVHSSCA